MIRTLRLQLAVLALALSALSTAAHAQLGVYGMFTVNRLSGIQSSPVLTTGLTYNNSVNPLGFTGGAFYDLKSLGPVRLGVDLRGSIDTTKRGALACCDGSGARIGSGLAGIRASFQTPIKYIKPYVQGSAGIGRSNYGVLTPSSSIGYLQNNFEYHGYAGVDVPFAPFADWRVFEAGYGALTSMGSGASHSYPVMSISTGVVLHLP